MNAVEVLRIVGTVLVAGGLIGHLATHLRPVHWKSGATVSRGTPFQAPRATATLEPKAKRDAPLAHTRRNA